jgi:cell division protein FtsZ
MTLEDMTTASEVIYDMVDPDANIIVGAVVDESLEGEIHVTVIATGFEGSGSYRTDRPLSSFADSIGVPQDRQEPVEVRGAKIPPFLLNRQTRLDME